MGCYCPPGVNRMSAHDEFAALAGRTQSSDARRDPLDEMIRFLRAAPRLPGVDRIYAHGEKEWETERERSRAGIPLHPAVVEGLRGLEPDFDVPFPAPLA